MVSRYTKSGHFSVPIKVFPYSERITLQIGKTISTGFSRNKSGLFGMKKLDKVLGLTCQYLAAALRCGVCALECPSIDNRVHYVALLWLLLSLVVVSPKDNHAR